MSNNPTLHSRIRVLVAKAFRAEKLYGSMRNTSPATILHSEESLGNVANELRAREWQKSHFLLRRMLNDILSNSGNSSDIARSVALLRDRFQKKAEESAHEMKRKSVELAEANTREEYAATLKLSVSLVGLKARAQANKVITDELTAVLESSGRSKLASGKGYETDEESFEKTGTLDGAFEQRIPESKGAATPSNVIPLRRKPHR